MLHIDFGYILTQAPPIDGPRFSISPAMQAGLTAVGVWGKFVDYSVKAFLALRDSAPEVVRTTVLLFSHADFEENVIREYMKSKVSLAVHSTEEAAAKSIQTQIDASATQWKMKVKSYTHDKVDRSRVLQAPREALPASASRDEDCGGQKPRHVQGLDSGTFI